MSDVASWGYDEVMKLISLLHKNPLLWDSDNLHFRNNFRRELAYDEISFALNTTNKCIKKKIHTLRSQYLAEYKRLKSKKLLKPVWQYFDDFKFIYKHDNLNFDMPNTLEDNKNPLNTTDDEESTTQDCDDFETHFVNDTEDDNNAPSSQNDVTNEPEPLNSHYESNEDLPRKRRRLNDAGEQLIDLEDKPEKSSKIIISTTSGIRDEYTIFGENLAMELRLLKGHQNIHDVLKSKIIRAIKEAKYGIYKAKLKT